MGARTRNSGRELFKILKFNFNISVLIFFSSVCSSQQKFIYRKFSATQYKN